MLAALLAGVVVALALYAWEKHRSRYPHYVYMSKKWVANSRRG